MDIGFGAALLLFGGLLAVAAALSGLMRGTALSISVLSVALGIVLRAAFGILASIVAHGLTDTVGARWIERRMDGSPP